MRHVHIAAHTVKSSFLIFFFFSWTIYGDEVLRVGREVDKVDKQCDFQTCHHDNGRREEEK